MKDPILIDKITTKSLNRALSQYDHENLLETIASRAYTSKAKSLKWLNLPSWDKSPDHVKDGWKDTANITIQAMMGEMF